MKNKKLFAILTLVCFMMTLMPVAAFAAVDAGTSEIFTVKDNPTVSLNTNEEASVDLTYTLRDASKTTESGIIYVWFTENGSVASSAVKSIDGKTAAKVGQMENVFAMDANYTDTVKAVFQRDGVFTLHAATEAEINAAASLTGKTQAEQFAALTEIKTVSTNNKVTVKTQNTSSSKYYLKDANGVLGNEAVATNGTFEDTLVLEANNVAYKTLKFTLYDAADLKDVVKGQTVTIETNSSTVETSKTSATTNALGQFSFDVSASVEGSYKIYITAGSYTATVNVQVGATGPAYISVAKSPSNPIDVDKTDLENVVRFTLTDINGNVLDANSTAVAALNACDADTNYVSIVSQPSSSDLENEDVYLAVDTSKKNNDGTYPYATLKFKAPLTAEGSYTFKVVLDNGKYTTVSFDVKEFTTPVKINLTYAAPSVELGGTAYIDKLEYVDANGVTKDCRAYVDVAATGYAIKNFNNTYNAANKGQFASVAVKSDEKYLGSDITVTAVDERYNLVATATLKVVDEAAELSFSTKTAEVDVNNAITVMLVDGEGNRVALGGQYTVDTINYVILDKPEGAKVTATTASADNNLTTAGTFKMNLTCNKVGNVAVQVIAKVTNRNADTDTQNVTKYYTGTQIFAVGNGSVGDVVVMSIGSHEIIVNDAKATIDAAPIVQNDRTFVPFRALAEAFGAEVAYDEATQAVTAKLNGVEVVMTIGSATYTVNGAEKTMDVAPFINGSRTMVPVRFVAEAFGIKVIPTYDQNGATADILFNL